MLVTLEGLDGSGKTTLLESLRDQYPEAVYTREPTRDSWYGEAVARSVADPDADPLAELFLYTADHAAHLSRIVCPALEDDRLVLSDRYSDSRYAYQGAAIAERVDKPVEFVQAVHEPWTRPPDATLYLDVDPETAAERADATNKFERAAFLADVHENYERLLAAEPDRFTRIDATRSPETVCEAATDVLDRLL